MTENANFEQNIDPNAVASAEASAAQHMAQPPPSAKLFVGQVPAVCTEDMLVPLFQPYGTLLEVKIMRDQQGRSKGCAWVRYETQEMAQNAIEALHEKHTIPPQTNTLRVQYAMPSKARQPNMPHQAMHMSAMNMNMNAMRWGAQGGPPPFHPSMWGMPPGMMPYAQMQQQQQPQPQHQYFAPGANRR